MIKIWFGPVPSECQSCGEPIDRSFSDVKTAFGPWGIVCDYCVPLVTRRSRVYGVGLGQKYEVRGQHWIKVEG